MPHSLSFLPVSNWISLPQWSFIVLRKNTFTLFSQEDFYGHFFHCSLTVETYTAIQLKDKEYIFIFILRRVRPTKKFIRLSSMPTSKSNVLAGLYFKFPILFSTKNIFCTIYIIIFVSAEDKARFIKDRFMCQAEIIFSVHVIQI